MHWTSHPTMTVATTTLPCLTDRRHFITIHIIVQHDYETINAYEGENGIDCPACICVSESERTGSAHAGLNAVNGHAHLEPWGHLWPNTQSSPPMQGAFCFLYTQAVRAAPDLRRERSNVSDYLSPPLKTPPPHLSSSICLSFSL